jgi:hypothetical protein
MCNLGVTGVCVCVCVCLCRVESERWTKGGGREQEKKGRRFFSFVASCCNTLECEGERIPVHSNVIFPKML